MEKLTKEVLEQWIKDNKWLQIGEMPTPKGRQDIYLSPSGQVTFIIHNLDGKIEIAQPPVFTISMPTMGRSPLVDFRGGSHLP